MARFPTSVSVTWALKIQEFVIHILIWFFMLQNPLPFPWCSCSPHIYVLDMVKQQTPSEVESKQLLITAAATGGSIWKCVTSSNHRVQSYKGWGGGAVWCGYLFQVALDLEVVFSLPKEMAVCKILSAKVRKGFPTCTDLGTCTTSAYTRISEAADRKRKNFCKPKTQWMKISYLKIWNCHNWSCRSWDFSAVHSSAPIKERDWSKMDLILLKYEQEQDMHVPI